MRGVWLVLALALPAAAQAEPHRASIEAFAGGAWNAPASLTVSQAGSGTIEHAGAWRTDALEFPIYWAVRVTRGTEAAAWSLELLHHKVFLDDPPAAIDDFGVSHGFNMLTLQRAWSVRFVTARAGAGMVIAHPENRVRGRALDGNGGVAGTGYVVAGPVLLAGAGRAWPFGAGWHAVAEVRATIAPARVPVADGRAAFTNTALHMLIGLGWSR